MNETNSIKCECNITYKLNEFINHYQKCTKFYNKFKDFDFKIVQLLKEFINSRESLIIIIFLLKRFLKVLKNKLESLEEINPKQFFKFKKTISSELSNEYCYNYRACIFSSKNDDNIYVAYGTSKHDLECYDVLNEKQFTVIKNLYNENFYSCRHFYDDNNSRDLILTCFSKDNKIKVINFQRENSKVILKLQFSNKSFIIRTIYFLNGKIIIPLSNGKINGIVQIYNMETKQQINLFENILDVFCINNYYYKKENINYTLICNKKGIFVYLINKIFFYKAFFGDEDNNGYYESYILEKNDRIIIIGALLNSQKFNNLYFWDLEKGNLIKKVNLGVILTDINIWNNNYIFASFLEEDYLFGLIDIDNNSIEKKFYNFNKQKGYGVKILNDKTKGEYLILLSSFRNIDLYYANNFSI